MKINKSFKQNMLIFLNVLFIIIIIYQWRMCYNIQDIYKYYRLKKDSYRLDLAVDSTGTLPFISGSNLVFIADYVYDNKITTKTDELKNGDIIFVKIDYIDYFFSWIYPKIKIKFILITHNGDYSTNIKHKKYLNQNKILAWFGQNPGFKHEKHIALPIGIENTFYFPDKIKFLRNVRQLIPWKDRKYLLYLNYDPSTNSKKRNDLANMFKSFENVLIITQKVNYSTYMTHIGNSKYVLCPRGNGLDTHRVYETILMESIPVIEHSILDDFYLNKSTSLIVNKYSDLNIEMLNNYQKYIKNINFSKDILYMEYWLNQIKKFKPELDVKKLIQY